MNTLLRDGMTIDGQDVKFKLRCFICDTPARSMIRGMYDKYKTHTTKM